MPRKVRKLSKGAPVTPMALAHQLKDWHSSSVAAITAPPTTSLCPFKYLVVECMDRSAPSAKGLLPNRRQKGIVHHRKRAGGARSFGDGADIDDAQQRIARRLDPNQLGAGRERRTQFFGVALVDEIHHQTALGMQRRQQSISPAIAIMRSEHAGTGRQGRQDQGDGRQACASDDGAGAAFEVGQSLGELYRASGCWNACNRTRAPRKRRKAKKLLER